MSAPAADDGASLQRAALRSWSFYARMVAVAAGIVALTALPSVAEALGFSWRRIAPTVAVVLLVDLAAMLVYRRWGERSRAYRVLAGVEALVQLGAVMSLLYSGRPGSFVWLLYVGYVAMTWRMVEHRRALLTLYSLAPALLCGVVLVTRGDWTFVGFAGAATAMGLLLFETGSRVALQLAESERARAAMSAQLAQARIEVERARIARDLHDGLGATLSAVGWRARSLAARADGGLATELTELATRAHGGVDELRSVVWSMHDTVRTEAEFCSYLEHRLRELCVDVRLDYAATGASDGELRPEIALAALRFAQEAARNALRHGHARSLEVRLDLSDGLVLEMRDDGRGFDPESAAPGTGLRGMRERAVELGGELRIERLERGMSVALRVPSHAHGRAEAMSAE